MNRRIIKSNALKNLKKDYLKIILVIFIVGIIVNSGYHFTTVISKNPISDISKSNYQIVNDLVHNFSSKLSIGGYKSGILGTLFNNITESNSIIIGFLNSINIYLLNNKINIIYISLIGLIIMLFIKIFIQDVFRIGYKRFFLEQRRYHVLIKRILFPFKNKNNLHIGLIILLKNIYQILWSFTIVFAPIKHYEYFMIPYVLAENPNIKRKQAFILSKELMNGYKFELFKLDLSLIGFNILNIFTFGLFSLLFLRGYKECIYAEVYIKIRRKKINNLSYKELLNDKYLDIQYRLDDEYPYYDNIEKHLKIKKDYHVKYTVRNYILMFFTFSIFGWIWEVIYHIISTGEFVNRGTMFGPWLPIYGTGGLLILIILKPLRDKPILFFIFTMLLAGIIEYTTGWYLETFKSAKWWDYTGYFLNIQGRVCLEGLLVFGLGGAAITYFIGPLLNELFDKIKPKIAIIICIILITLYGIDYIYSFSHPNKGVGITEFRN